mmetsp:Transcript_4539/g.7407  ORF Transcript_4539/g.7407 Transcript_4539/m.7407 type:complete len:204 (-) Transcript_4539:376-987(-)
MNMEDLRMAFLSASFMPCTWTGCHTFLLSICLSSASTTGSANCGLSRIAARTLMVKANSLSYHRARLLSCMRASAWISLITRSAASMVSLSAGCPLVDLVDLLSVGSDLLAGAASSSGICGSVSSEMVSTGSSGGWSYSSGTSALSAGISSSGRSSSSGAFRLPDLLGPSSLPSAGPGTATPGPSSGTYTPAAVPIPWISAIG